MVDQVVKTYGKDRMYINSDIIPDKTFSLFICRNSTGCINLDQC